MPKVFIVQEDQTKDFRPAERWGELHVLILAKESRSMNNNQLMDVLYRRLEGFMEGDFLLLVGSPKLIGMAFLAANRIVAKFNILVWDRLRYTYNQETIDE